MCVLASAMDAVDRGYRVVIVSDAVASSREAGHRAVLEHVLGRLDAQVEMAPVEAVLAAWPRP